ncbi:hypothetical protein [Rhizobium mesoamericanum]|uniref:hypothetical protein n=1 Tax=Rhizobium mesoamericanum TaxID=1079800 RepID=UPI00031678E0|nr:hypothetical protein [Rhizobium mesoamericanum]
MGKLVCRVGQRGDFRTLKLGVFNQDPAQDIRNGVNSRQRGCRLAHVDIALKNPPIEVFAFKANTILSVTAVRRKDRRDPAGPACLFATANTGLQNDVVARLRISACGPLVLTSARPE